MLYSAILASTLIAFSVVLYITLSQATQRALEERLADEARTLIAAKEFEFGHIVLPAKKFAARDTFVQTLTLDREVNGRTDNLSGFTLPLSDAGLQAVRQGEAWTETGSIENQHLLIYNRPVTLRGSTVGILQVARSLEGQEQSLRTLRSMLIAGSGIATVTAFGIGWVLAGTALRPINRITQTAQAIGAERDFGRRVHYSGPNDEVGRLATTLNTMLTELQAAYRQVEQALQAQRRFAADASHELRTPLTTIRGNIGLLQRDPPISAEDRVAALADMADETDRLIRLVNDLLVLARADAGRPWRDEPVLIKPIIEDLCRKARLLEPERMIGCDDVLDVAVTGNQDALKQVLLILLDNALKFTPDSGEIAIRTAVVDGHVAISVHDTGAGIPPAALPHIFERFYRADTTRTGGGTGLGLAIAKALVEAQHGTLTVESQVGQGSVFTVTLPRASVHPELRDNAQLRLSVH